MVHVTDWSADLELALQLADQADALTMSRYAAADLVVETKPDLTPVSDADKATEELLRTQVAAARPGDALIGEEFGLSGDAERRWVFDPIDGTKNYVRAVPVWATLIALQHNEKSVVGVVSAPALGRRWWAAAGHGAWTSFQGGDPKRCQVSAVSTISDASLSHASVMGWEEAGKLQPFLDLLRSCWRTRGFGDFWGYMLVAEGAVDIATEPSLSLWDLAPITTIVEEAGGRFTDLSGVARADGGSGLASNGLLHDHVLAALGPPASASD
jgi:histidinol-phosphatase